MASAGRVLLMPKGTWTANTEYNPLDFVYYGGNSYVCKATVSGAVDPTNDTTHWQQMASGFDSDLITQTITNEPKHIASDAAVYAECQKLESNFAIIESSSTASQNYSVGQYLTLNGVLYIVTDPIATGGTITPGTNVTQTNAGTELKALNDSLPKRIASAAKSNSVTLNFPMNSLNVIWTAGNSANTQTAVFSVNATSNGSLSIVDIRTATEVSHSTNGYNATITNSNTRNGLRICCINLYGGFPTEV